MGRWLNLFKTDKTGHDSEAIIRDPVAPGPLSNNKNVETDKSQITSNSNTRKRKYNEAFLQYEFTFSSTNNEDGPVCLICNEYLTSKSLKPAKLKIHLDTRHASYSNKSIHYFERLLESSKKTKTFS